VSTPTPPPPESDSGGGSRPLTPPSAGGPVPPSVGVAGAYSPRRGPVGSMRPPHAPAGHGPTNVPGAGQGPRAPKRPSTPSSILFAHPSRQTLLAAAIAVGALLVVKFVVAFVQLLGNAIDYSPTAYSSGFLASPIGLFLGSLVLYPFFFYLAAFLALTLVFPVVKESPLSTILGRGVAAGAVGTIVLAVVGIVTGVVQSASTGDWVLLVLYVVFIPLATGVQLTAILVGGTVLAWLWTGRQPSNEVGNQDPGARPASASRDESASGQAAAPVGPSTPPAAPRPPVAPTEAPPLSLFAPPTDRPAADAPFAPPTDR
jgi:hypothetical protein